MFLKNSRSSEWMAAMSAALWMMAAAVSSQTGVEPTTVADPVHLRLQPSATEIPSNISNRTRSLSIKDTQIMQIPSGVISHLQLLRQLYLEGNEKLKNIGPFTFANLSQLSEIAIIGHLNLQSIGAFAFSNLPGLTVIIIKRSKHLTHIHPDAFTNIPNLNYLCIHNTGLLHLPGVTKLHSNSIDFIFDMQENPKISSVPSNAFRGLCTQVILEIRLPRNGIKEVASDAFNGTKVYSLSLKGNQQLTSIHPNAFAGCSELVGLDVSNTAVNSLPVSILSGLEELKAKSTVLKKLPLPELTHLHEAVFTNPYHCCAFLYLHVNRSRWHPVCENPEAKNDVYLFQELCGSPTCVPMPDEFNPCEDILSSVPLRVINWTSSVLGLLGNTLVLLVLIGTLPKLTIPRFLMCNLGLADLCQSVFMLIIATMDARTRGEYYNYAIDWQGSSSCKLTGFLSVFSSELSVFTLTALTLERWHTITFTLRVDRKLRMRHACALMAAGWLFALVAAFLPTVGVSSYGKVSMCLPMDVTSVVSQVYVVSLLLLNIVAFVCVCACYLSIYRTAHNPSSMPAHPDAHMAQRMAVLIFTDFLCLAPISFFALSAALKYPLITVSQSKFLLVLFYPINACANPFLYAFFHSSFRQDFFQLAARFGLFKKRAKRYRMEGSVCP